MLVVGQWRFTGVSACQFSSELTASCYYVIYGASQIAKNPYMTKEQQASNRQTNI